MKTRLYYDPKTETTFAGLRKNSILAEVLLWKQLEGSRMLGYSFLRQIPIYKYIVDFYSPKLRVVIEIDGESPSRQVCKGSNPAEGLESLGLNVLRFHDHDVKRDMANVLRCIENWIEQHVKENDHGHPPTPPSKGE